MDDQVLPDQASVCIELSPYSPRVGPGSVRTSFSSSSSSYSPSSSSSYSTSSSSCSSIAAAAAAPAAAGPFVILSPLSCNLAGIAGAVLAQSVLRNCSIRG